MYWLLGLYGKYPVACSDENNLRTDYLAAQGMGMVGLAIQSSGKRYRTFAWAIYTFRSDAGISQINLSTELSTGFEKSKT